MLQEPWIRLPNPCEEHLGTRFQAPREATAIRLYPTITASCC
ncbi:hypothetical protein Ahy_B05g076948 isoform B [Arachis hypogaea]|uniref:Uncharacterized protein n=1 Tax=Arachis hypogaea TaxID=3818 RepID=A0A444Z468_ARAHY|nr:hypothetical protein Ahy_B05g076948 isoform B [Arachis hypogaea]